MALFLDQVEELKALDPQGILPIMSGFQKQVSEALELAESIPPTDREIRNAVVLGMGGSAIGADLACGFLGGRLRVPFQVVRSYELPAYVGPQSLVVAGSYSGNTEETLSAFQRALDTGAEIWCLASGGRLLELAEENRRRLLRLPSGQPPRTAFMFSFVCLLGLLERYAAAEPVLVQIRESLDRIGSLLARYGPECPQASNPAKQLAVRLIGRIPIVYGSANRLFPVARRWAAQLTENAKQLAYACPVPEMNHNEIVGWKNPEGVLDHLLPIFLTDRGDHSRIRVRLELTRGILARRTEDTLEIRSRGETWPERLWDLILMGDYTSIYLALLNRENPTEIAVIDELKNRLARV